MGGAVGGPQLEGTPGPIQEWEPQSGGNAPNLQECTELISWDEPGRKERRGEEEEMREGEEDNKINQNDRQING